MGRSGLLVGLSARRGDTGVNGENGDGSSRALAQPSPHPSPGCTQHLWRRLKGAPSWREGAGFMPEQLTARPGSCPEAAPAAQPDSPHAPNLRPTSNPGKQCKSQHLGSIPSTLAEQPGGWLWPHASAKTISCTGLWPDAIQELRWPCARGAQMEGGMGDLSNQGGCGDLCLPSCLQIPGRHRGGQRSPASLFSSILHMFRRTDPHFSSSLHFLKDRPAVPGLGQAENAPLPAPTMLPGRDLDPRERKPPPQHPWTPPARPDPASPEQSASRRGRDGIIQLQRHAKDDQRARGAPGGHPQPRACKPGY